MPKRKWISPKKLCTITVNRKKQTIRIKGLRDDLDFDQAMRLADIVMELVIENRNASVFRMWDEIMKAGPLSELIKKGQVKHEQKKPHEERQNRLGKESKKSKARPNTHRKGKSGAGQKDSGRKVTP